LSLPISSSFRGSPLWSFALYALPGPFTPDTKLKDPVALFNSKRLRFFRAQPHTQADPFLLVERGTLFIFYEQMYPGSVGKIACSTTSDLSEFEDHGVVLAEPYHLSFPFVFRAGAAVYMVPESLRTGQVNLYRFEALPQQLSQMRTLLSGDYVDAVLIEEAGHWYLFATRGSRLELFVARDLLSGEFLPHPKSPIVSDSRYSRNGGAPMRLGATWVRVAQDCSRAYGENVSLLEITRLTPDDYAERMLAPNFFKREDFWNREGAHHLSVAEFKGRTVVAVDGKHRDYWINKLLPVR
jgi:hypothetical protein